ncbi:MAG: DUF5009 domain-containing protein [Akkermansia sp.]|nr:DUF5009 domain-containing protein [Akkermansia sp.]MBQ8516464.1 DUF5009 domain-containing protein [Akkermansia sp.]
MADFRITSIDALRGLDMLLLCGGAAVLQLLLENTGSAPGWLLQQFRHAEWGGAFTCWDLVMPLFIFITGASMPFAFARYREKGGSRWRFSTARRVLRRVALLFVLGMLVQGNLASAVPAQMSLFCNTLQAIAEGYLIASVVLMFCHLRGQIISCLLCLVSYWALLRFVPYAGNPGGLFRPDNNLALHIDLLLQGSWQDGTPYTWILTALSFGALTLMGSICGSLIRARRGLRTVGLLSICGAGCLLAALLLEADTPLIKHIYTTTAVLWSGGWCILLLALFHLLFDCCGPRMTGPAFPLRVIGCNALLAYLLTEIHGPGGHSIWHAAVHPLIYGPANLYGNSAPLAHAALSLLLLWLTLLFLYRHKAFLRV